ncbi:hypothetical protein N7468_005096 [Penicillium chermesinum]|uniref:Uncharacterized protein n=1 Tax=Penicillium chermesinum TaxID=63820 RepID=A0A9W9NZ64_9EURO|nr:uncharacterized protein N7468_005096 [Penicillium chermesinum]KAJ5232140.1 hypothetical protein N7468_005096 [Penicillium chermesinum]
MRGILEAVFALQRGKLKGIKKEFRFFPELSTVDPRASVRQMWASGAAVKYKHSILAKISLQVYMGALDQLSSTILVKMVVELSNQFDECLSRCGMY